MFTTAGAQQVYKVDINEWSRTNMDEVLEPGFTPWRFEKDTNESTLDMGDGVTFVIRSDHNMRGGWNKAFVQKKDNNSRLTGDGVNLDPNECGSLQLVIKGLTPGSHNIQTYHNGWSDPANTVGWPITISLNGKVVHQSVARTLQIGSMKEATVLMTEFSVASTDEEVVFSISTSEDDAPADAGTKKNNDKTPLLNGFMIDVANSTLQAKLPVPADRDMHIDADNGSFTLEWSAANTDVKAHRLYFGTDSMSVAEATTPVYEGTDTCYTVSDLYNLNVYYWRIDEVFTDGTTAKGDTWQFQPRHLAFPGAEGYGRFARGGRGGTVYHVTNLSNDMEPGSFVYGLVGLKGPRTIVFDVSGIINLDFTARFTSNVTIAAQTAPGKGICLMHSNINVGSESICRHLRARRGLGTSEQTGNAMGVTGADHCIVDHSTLSWGTDETFSSRNAKNVTFQNSIISEALGLADHKNYGSNKNHGFAATIGGDVGTFSHNLLANCAGRNWSMGGGLDGDGYYAGRLDIFNNVVYNWKNRTTDGGAHEVNFVGNYYKDGPASGISTIFTLQLEGLGKGSQSAYLKDNILERQNGTILKDAASMYSKQVAQTQIVDWDPFPTAPMFPSYATIDSPENAYKKVTSDVGAQQPVQDDTDLRIIHETLTGTYTYTGSRSGIKGEIDNEADAGGFELYPEEQRPANWDTDQDGMPDWWEHLVGSNPGAADNNDDPDHDGYTLLEDYLNFMAEPHYVMAPGMQTSIDVKALFAGFTKNPQYAADVTGIVATAQLADDMLTMTASSGEGLATVLLTVIDAEGSTYSRQLNVAVSGEGSQTAVRSVTAEDIVSYELFDLSGHRLEGQPRQGTVYLMRATDRQGRQHVVKAIKQ